MANRRQVAVLLGKASEIATICLQLIDIFHTERVGSGISLSNAKDLKSYFNQNDQNFFIIFWSKQ